MSPSMSSICTLSTCIVKSCWVIINANNLCPNLCPENRELCQGWICSISLFRRTHAMIAVMSDFIDSKGCLRTKLLTVRRVLAEHVYSKYPRIQHLALTRIFHRMIDNCQRLVMTRDHWWQFRQISTLLHTTSLKKHTHGERSLDLGSAHGPLLSVQRHKPRGKGIRLRLFWKKKIYLLVAEHQSSLEGISPTLEAGRWGKRSFACAEAGGVGPFRSHHDWHYCPRYGLQGVGYFVLTTLSRMTPAS